MKRFARRVRERAARLHHQERVLQAARRSQQQQHQLQYDDRQQQLQAAEEAPEVVEEEQTANMSTTMEGSLSKWTNVVNGWQYRWFVLDDNAGLLSYYTVSCFLFS